MRRQTIFVLALFFAAVPATAKQQAADPAVVHANSVRSDGIAYTEGYFGEGDNRLHYVEAGKGPLVILYHGFPSFWFSWFDQMERLKTRYHVVAVDGLGAGLSAKPDAVAAYRIDKLAAQIDRLARHLNGKTRFTLVGHDWGAALAFAYAQAYPKRLNAVIGMSAPPYNLFLDIVRTNKEQQQRSQYMQIFRGITLDTIKERKLTEQIWQQAYGALIKRGDLTRVEGELFRAALSDPRAINGGMNWYRANMPPIADIDPNTYWPGSNPPITIPALLIWGETDKTFVPEFLDDVKAYIPQVNILRLPAINHWTTIENPKLASEAVDCFISENARKRMPSAH